jgi:hypothetical protein
VTDGGPGDAGAADAGATDAGTTDAGPPDAGLCGNIACFHFEEGSGTTTADATGLNPGTLINGPTWTTGRIGKALQFDGSTTRVDLGNGPGLHLTSSLTLAAWIRPTGLPSGNDDAVIISKMQGDVRGFQLDTTIDRGPRAIGFKLQDPSGNYMMRYGQTAVSQDVWHHVAGVYDASRRTMEVYLDGRRDDGDLVGTVATSQFDATGSVTIGSRSGAPGTYDFNGIIDEVMIFDRPLSEPEIRELYLAAP